MVSGAVKSVPRVFDKYMLPKVAFTVITLASMAGAALTGLRLGLESWAVIALRWSTLWTLAMLAGSEAWKIFYLRPSVKIRPVAGAVEYGEAMIVLHRKWEKALSIAVGLLAATDLAVYWVVRPGSRLWAVIAAAALATAITAAAAGRRQAPQAMQQDRASWVTLGGLVVAIAALATLDVSLQAAPPNTPEWLLMANRTLHLWAFSAWLGGALWNIFIAVPAGMSRVSMDSVILANFQLERFRVVVRTVFPTIVLTGLVQAWAMFGWHWHALIENRFGYLVLTKLGLILVLVGVFIACPMWHACSPIRGVCDLDDLM
jgi:putative copper resistance protein D